MDRYLKLKEKIKYKLSKKTNKITIKKKTETFKTSKNCI